MFVCFHNLLVVHEFDLASRFSVIQFSTGLIVLGGIYPHTSLMNELKAQSKIKELDGNKTSF